MFVITFRGFGNSIKGKTLWKIACLTLVWFVWQERHAMVFENKERWKGCCRTYFTSIPLCGLLVLPILGDLHIQFYNILVNDHISPQPVCNRFP